MDLAGAALLLMAAGTTFGAAMGLADDEVRHLLALRTRGLREVFARARPPTGGAGGEASGRKKYQVLHDMPGFLDIVTLGLSAGLSFDASLELYCARYQTVLAQRLANAMLLWRLGIEGRAEALEGMARDMDDAAMDRFAATVSEALAFGAPLSEALSRQAEVLRAEQRALVEEEIERVPVKLLLPMGAFIVPAMLIAILGPLLGPVLAIT